MRAWLIVWLIAVGALSVLDIHSTYLCLSVPDGDIEEANPILAWLINKCGIPVGLLIIGTTLKMTAIVISAFFINWALDLISTIEGHFVRAFLKSFISAAMVFYLLALLFIVNNNYGLLINPC